MRKQSRLSCRALLDLEYRGELGTRAAVLGTFGRRRVEQVFSAVLATVRLRARRKQRRHMLRWLLVRLLRRRWNGLHLVELKLWLRRLRFRRGLSL